MLNDECFKQMNCWTFLSWLSHWRIVNHTIDCIVRKELWFWKVRTLQYVNLTKRNTKCNLEKLPIRSTGSDQMNQLGEKWIVNREINYSWHFLVQFTCLNIECLVSFVTPKDFTLRHTPVFVGSLSVLSVLHKCLGQPEEKHEWIGVSPMEGHKDDWDLEHIMYR